MDVKVLSWGMLHLRKDQILCDKQGCQVFRNLTFQMDPLHFCKLLISFSDILFHSPFVVKVKVERLHFFPFLFHCKQTFLVSRQDVPERWQESQDLLQLLQLDMATSSCQHFQGGWNQIYCLLAQVRAPHVK